MTDAVRGKRILVVEDEYLLADDLRNALEDAGAEVIGPVADVDGALALIAGEGGIDAALLDINLSGATVYPVADLLAERTVPFAFATGYDEVGLPDRFASVARLEKPVKPRDVLGALAAMFP